MISTPNGTYHSEGKTLLLVANTRSQTTLGHVTRPIPAGCGLVEYTHVLEYDYDHLATVAAVGGYLRQLSNLFPLHVRSRIL